MFVGESDNLGDQMPAARHEEQRSQCVSAPQAVVQCITTYSNQYSSAVLVSTVDLMTFT